MTNYRRIAAGQILLIRTNADSRIGAGHVMRCLALAQAWQNAGGRAIFLSQLPETLINRLTAERIEYIPANTPCHDPADLAQILKQAAILGTRQPKKLLLVLDGYHFTPKYQQTLRQAGLQTLVLDDYGHLPVTHARWLLNQNPWADAIDYTDRLDPDCCLLTGLTYALIRLEFIAVASQKRTHIEKYPLRVLVTMGGSDPTNTTELIVEVLSAARLPSLTYTVVTGPAYRWQQALKNRFSVAHLAGEVLTNVADISKCMTQTDLAITAGGSTCWELACLGVPMLVLALAENQTRTGPALAAAGAAIDLGRLEETPNGRLRLASCITDSLVRLLHDNQARMIMAEAGRHIVDGYGADRVIAKLLKNRS
ncbi:UDP-2,4-diacetamido-2,4, 6-trideoxy-beta-L-altropyranose hydrolase [Desulfovibrionales bacterium]